jgi:hypothetical protein
MAQLRAAMPKALTVLAWLGTAVLGLVDIYFGREIFFAIYARYSYEGAPALVFGNLLLLVLAVAYMIYAVVSMEYHLKHAGEPRSWKVLAQTYAVMLLIPIIAYFM